MNELTSSRVANDVVSRRTQTELLTNLIKQTLDCLNPHTLSGWRCPASSDMFPKA